MATNETLVNWLRAIGYADEKVANAMLQIDRKGFLPENEKDYAYLDVPLPLGYGVTTSAPSIIARMLVLLDVRRDMKVLEIGVGSGYQTALLAKLVGESGKVIGVEINPELLEFAEENLTKYSLTQISLIRGSGAAGNSKEAPYDRILYSAALRKMPGEAVGQLASGGKLIVPVGDVYQTLYLVEKKDEKIETTEFDTVIFSPIM